MKNKQIEFTKEYFDSLGYDILSDDGVYIKCGNKAGLECPSYGILPRNKRLLFFNKSYDKAQGIFLGVREDGDTRTVFNGVVENLEQLEMIIKLVR